MIQSHENFQTEGRKDERTDLNSTLTATAEGSITLNKYMLKANLFFLAYTPNPDPV